MTNTITNDTVRHEATYFGGEGESVFPVPFPFQDASQITADITAPNGVAYKLLPGLEYIVNRISDGHGELILLEEELGEGKTLRIRVAEAERDIRAVAEAETEVAEDAAGEAAALRGALDLLRLDACSRLESLESRLDRMERRRPLAGLARRLLARLFRAVRNAWLN